MRRAVSILKNLAIGCGAAFAVCTTGVNAAGPDLVLEAPSDQHPGGFMLSTEFDGEGGALMVWNARCSAAAASRSNDNGITWGPARVVFAGDAPYYTNFAFDLAHGAGTWIVVWRSADTLGGTLAPNPKILAARSTDGGSTWSDAVALSAPDLKSEFPSIATDGLGRWIVAWHGVDRILYTRSSDDGLTWTAPAPLGLSGTTIDFEIKVSLATDRAGTWIAVWPESVGSFLWDVRWARSTNAGLTWSAPAFLPAGTQGNEHPVIAAGGAGRWLIAWGTRDADASWNDLDIVASRSGNGGLTWSPAFPVNTSYEVDGILDEDERPEIATDGHGNWIVAWRFQPPGTFNCDVVGARSGDMGANWSSSATLHTGGAMAGEDLAHEIVADGRGTWMLSWSNSQFQQPVRTYIAPFRLHFTTTCGSDLDGDGYGSAGEPICPFGTTPDCNEANVRIAPGAADLCDGSSNDCTSSGWPALAGTNEADDDGDGLSECALDCDDTLEQVWSAPGAPVLALAKPFGATILNWSLPDPGGLPGSAYFDTFRSTTPEAGSCIASWTCLEGDATDASTADGDSPAVGEAFFYVVSAQNACSAEIPAQLTCP